MRFMTKIHLANAEGVSAMVRLLSVAEKRRGRYEWNGQAVKTTPLLLTSSEKFDFSGNLPDTLASHDFEIHELVGMPMAGASKVFVGKDGRPARTLALKEVVTNVRGEEVEKRDRVKLVPNICDETKPVRPIGKPQPREKLLRSLAFKSSYQIGHADALTYKFLYDIAAQLDGSMVMVGAGGNGKQPIVMKSAGLPHRAFLSGRTFGDEYVLMLHLTNLELKAPEREEVS